VIERDIQLHARPCSHEARRRHQAQRSSGSCLVMLCSGCCTCTHVRCGGRSEESPNSKPGWPVSSTPACPSSEASVDGPRPQSSPPSSHPHSLPPIPTTPTTPHPSTMVLKLRLARISTPGGAKRHHPRYNIVLAHARTARDSRPLEVLGTYNPIPSTPAGVTEEDVRAGRARKVKEIKVDVSRAKYWLGVGAQPSDTVWRVLSMVCFLVPRRGARGVGGQCTDVWDGCRLDCWSRSTCLLGRRRRKR